MSNPVYKVRLKKGDTVMVRSGKFKGQTGQITEVHPKTNQVTVEGVNIVKRHTKASRSQPQGGILEVTKPIHVSKVGIYDPVKKKPSRIGYKFDKNNQKVRIYKTSGKEIA